MKPTVTILAPGNMGAAIGAVLVKNGLEVRTSLAGRSAASAERAQAAGMIPVEGEALVDVDIFLSVLPPAEALPLASAIGDLIQTRANKPLYVDCNAVSPDTVTEVAKAIEATGGPFADGGIIGFPPREGYNGPRLYVSGPEAHQVAVLTTYGLDVRVLDGPVGAASALKMSYAGITKGINAIATAMILAADRSGAADALAEEIKASLPSFVQSFSRSVPNSFDKAYRWVAEMNEIAEFAGNDEAARDMFQAISALYGHIAEDRAGPETKTSALVAFLEKANLPGG